MTVLGLANCFTLEGEMTYEYESIKFHWLYDYVVAGNSKNITEEWQADVLIKKK